MIGIFAMAAAAAAGAPPTVFGLEFGEPLSIPVCRHQVLPGGTISVTYESEPAATCYEPDIQLSDAPWRRGSVDFPTNRKPLISKVNMINTLIIDGRLEGLEISTPDHNHTALIVDELTGKFGKPAEVRHQQTEIEGIAVPALEFTWRVHGLTVTYTNIDEDMGYGSIEIETSAMRRLRHDHDENASKARTAL